MRGQGRLFWMVAMAAATFCSSARLVVAQAAAPAGGAPVVNIVVEGNKRLSEQAILVHVRTRVGQPYDESVAREDQLRLHRTGNFDRVEVAARDTPQGVVVIFKVVERPVVAGVEFRNNKAFKASRLMKELTFGAGDPLDPTAVESGRQGVLQLYRSQGYHAAEVRYDGDVLRTRRTVIYTIKEGPRVVVRKIRFKGNRFFGSWRLRQEVGIAERFWPFVSGYLDAEQLERDVHGIRNLYVEAGFLDARVGRILEPSDGARKLTVTFVIDEGPRYRVSEVTFKGNSVFYDAELTRRVKLVPGEHLTREHLQADVAAIQDTYGELGYIEAQVSARKLYKEQPGLVDLIFEVTEADKYAVGQVTIRGNDVTQSHVIRRELRFYPGQPFNTVAVRESRNRLLDTQLFGEVSLHPLGQQPGVRDVLVEVQEAETGLLMVGASYNTNSGLLGNIALKERNFDILRWPRSWDDFRSGRAWRGGGQILTISAEPGLDLMRFHIDWFEPALFDKPYSLGAKAFVFTRGRESYDETRYGGVVSFGHRFRNRWYGEVATRIEGIEIDSLESDAPPEVVADSGTHALLGVKTTLVRDRTDSRWRPTQGDRFHLSYEQVFGDYNFGHASGGYKIYHTVYTDVLNRKHILAGRVRAGYICGDSPVFERFYGGGLGSIRGFEYRGISPRSAGTDEQIGGEFLFYAGAEYEFPLIGQYIRGVVFLDSGTVERQFDLTTYRVSAGLGIRWIIPQMGQIPISLDFGFPISRDDQDDRQVFNFSIGWLF